MDEPTESEILTANKLGMEPMEFKRIMDIHIESLTEVLSRRYK